MFDDGSSESNKVTRYELGSLEKEETRLASNIKEEDLSLPIILHSASSDPGIGLTENEDAYSAFETANFRMFMLADGTGGAAHGRDTALRVLSSIQFSLHQKNDLAVNDIDSAIRNANQEILGRTANIESDVKIGSTLAGIAFAESGVFVFNVGNTRLFRIRNGKILQLTVDHTVEGQLRRGMGTKEPLPSGSRPSAHLLTSAIGLTEDIEIHVAKLESPPEVGDIYFLCTDGVYDVVSESDMLSILCTDDMLKRLVRRLVTFARNQGSTDNITGLVLKIEKVPSSYRKAEAPEALAVGKPGVVPSGQVSVDKSNKSETKSIESVDDEDRGEEEAERWLESKGAGKRDANRKGGRHQVRSKEDRFAASLKTAERDSADKKSLDASRKARLNATFNSETNPSAGGGELKSIKVKGTTPFIDFPKGATKVPFVDQVTRRRNFNSSINVLVITVVAISTALFAASFIAQQFHFDEYLRNRERNLIAGNNIVREDRIIGDAPLVTGDMTKEESLRFLKIANEVSDIEERYSLKSLLYVEPVLAFDRVRNVELRNLMLNIYASIQLIVVQNKKNIDRLAADNEALRVNVEKLQLQIDKINIVSGGKKPKTSSGDTANVVSEEKDKSPVEDVIR